MPHQDYEGRLVGARNFWTNRGTLNDPNRTDDCGRHGSGVAAGAAGTKYGVAKGAKLFSVKVFGCSTSDSSVSDYIAGVNWIAAEKRNDPGRSMVASMSLIANPSSLLDDAIIGLISAGVAALHLEREPGLTPAQVESRIKGYATRDRISDTKGAPNLLLYSFYRKTRTCCTF
jgi:hypothetical protein